MDFNQRNQPIGTFGNKFNISKLWIYVTKRTHAINIQNHNFQLCRFFGSYVISSSTVCGLTAQMSTLCTFNVAIPLGLSANPRIRFEPSSKDVAPARVVSISNNGQHNQTTEQINKQLVLN